MGASIKLESVESCALNRFMAVRWNLKTRLKRFNVSESIQRLGYESRVNLHHDAEPRAKVVLEHVAIFFFFFCTDRVRLRRGQIQCRSIILRDFRRFSRTRFTRWIFCIFNQRRPVKRVHPWVDLSRSDKVGLSQGGSEAAMLCCSFTSPLFFLALFLLSVMNTMMFNDPSHFFQKPKLLLCKINEEQIFSIGEYFHLWIEWSGSEKAEWS